MIAVALAVAAFLAGSVPFGLLIGRWCYGIDLRAIGSGNIGAANALRSLGRPGAVAVLVLDALKGALPALAGIAAGGPVLGAACGFAAVAGHCFSPWLAGRGGKGVATNLGVAFALFWPAGCAFVAIWVGLALVFRYSSVGSMTGSVAMIAVLGDGIGWAGAAYGLASAILIVVQHRENLARLRAGNERRLSFGRKHAADPEEESRRQAS